MLDCEHYTADKAGREQLDQECYESWVCEQLHDLNCCYSSHVHPCLITESVQSLARTIHLLIEVQLIAIVHATD